MGRPPKGVGSSSVGVSVGASVGEILAERNKTFVRRQVMRIREMNKQYFYRPSHCSRCILTLETIEMKNEREQMYKSAKFDFIWKFKASQLLCMLQLASRTYQGWTQGAEEEEKSCKGRFEIELVTED